MEIQKIEVDNTLKPTHTITSLSTGTNKENSDRKKVDSNEGKTKEQEKQIIDAIEQANGKLEAQYKELSFSVHEQTKQIMIKVINKENKEVIREIPSEKILDMIANMMNTAGIFVDEKR